MPAKIFKSRLWSVPGVTNFVIRGDSFAEVQFEIDRLMNDHDCREATFSLPGRDRDGWGADGFVRSAQVEA